MELHDHKTVVSGVLGKRKRDTSKQVAKRKALCQVNVAREAVSNTDSRSPVYPVSKGYPPSRSSQSDDPTDLPIKDLSPSKIYWKMEAKKFEKKIKRLEQENIKLYKEIEQAEYQGVRKREAVFHGNVQYYQKSPGRR